MRTVRYVSILLIFGLTACSLDEAEMREQARGGGGSGEAQPLVASSFEYLEPDADIEACETYIRAGLESPSSYKRLSVMRRDQPISFGAYADMLGELGAISAIRDNIELKANDRPLALREVTIESVGDDFAGPRTRRKDICRFAVYGGLIPESDGIDDEVRSAIDRRQFYRMAQDGLIAGLDAAKLRSEYSAGCCLPRDAYSAPAEAAR